jgi:hypothetical protein
MRIQIWLMTMNGKAASRAMKKGFSECEGSDSETDTTKSSKQHGNGVLHQSKLSSDQGNTLDLDLDDTLDPNHHLSILSSLIRRIAKQPDFLAGWPKQLELLVRGLEADATKDKILNSLDPDLRQLIETRQLRLETLRLCNRLKPSKARSCGRPGVYVYDPTSDCIGIYIGSALKISQRIPQHDMKLVALLKPKNMRKQKKSLSITTSGLERRLAISGWFLDNSIVPKREKTRSNWDTSSKCWKWTQCYCSERCFDIYFARTCRRDEKQNLIHGRGLTSQIQ